MLELNNNVIVRYLFVEIIFIKRERGGDLILC